MKSQESRVVKLAVMVVFCTLALGHLLAQRITYAVSPPQRPQTKNPLQPTEKNIALGLDHFDAHCASCHRSTGSADIEKRKVVRAADLTSDKVQSKSDAELFRKISSGVPGTAMPAFGKTHKLAEIWQAILLLRKLPTLTPEGRKKLESAVPASARHKHRSGKGEGLNWFVNWADFPSLVALSDGALVAHWLVKGSPDSHAYYINISRSTDSGKTWTKPILPHGTMTEHGFVSMLPWTSGRVAAVWLDGRNFKESSQDGPRGSRWSNRSNGTGWF